MRVSFRECDLVRGNNERIRRRVCRIGFLVMTAAGSQHSIEGLGLSGKGSTNERIAGHRFGSFSCILSRDIIIIIIIINTVAVAVFTH